ncbi:MAG: hypothetical protein EPN21_03395 [Methylococcaceae bacterium]|nr:MAG: hypothetical protein EPN21_03395 [Methylococcaceae bacterium]
MSIKYRLLSMILIPTLWGILLTAWFAHSRYAVYEETRTIVELTRLATVASELIHELQKERGRSSGFFNSQGGKFGSEMREQRRVTDVKLTAYRALLDSGKQHGTLNASRKKIAENLSRLADNRTAIDQLQGSADSAIGYYTQTIAALIESIHRIGELVTDNKTIFQALGNYTNLIELKERTGIIRAVYAGVFGRNSFSEYLYRRALELEAESRIFDQLFRANALPDYLAFYDKTLDDDAVREVDGIKRAALENHAAQAFNVAPERWFGLITAKIDLQKKVENHIAEDILQQAADAMATEQQNLMWLAGLFLLFTGLSIWINIHIYHGIVAPLRTASWMLGRLARGDFNF